MAYFSSFNIFCALCYEMMIGMCINYPMIASMHGRYPWATGSFRVTGIREITWGWVQTWVRWSRINFFVFAAVRVLGALKRTVTLRPRYNLVGCLIRSHTRISSSEFSWTWIFEQCILLIDLSMVRWASTSNSSSSWTALAWFCSILSPLWLHSPSLCETKGSNLSHGVEIGLVCGDFFWAFWLVFLEILLKFLEPQSAMIHNYS